MKTDLARISGQKEEARKEKEMCGIESLNRRGSLDSNREDSSATLILTFSLCNVRKIELSKAAKVFETFEAQIHHFETRRAKKPNNSAVDLDIFVECEAHSADVSPLITSLKRVADDVRTSREDKVPQTNVTIWSQSMIPVWTMVTLGDPLPRIEYTSQETATWREVYRNLSSLYPTHACSQYLDAFQQLEKYCGYQENNIPQLQDVSRFLKDCCHELLGHVPMLAKEEFAHFSQDIGLASLGSSEAEIEKLATYALSNKPEHKPFDPEVTAVHPYQDQAFQPGYFIAKSLEDAKAKFQSYTMKIKKPFSLHYDSFTTSVEVMNTPQKVKKALCQMKEELKSLCLALENLS